MNRIKALAKYFYRIIKKLFKIGFILSVLYIVADIGLHFMIRRTLMPWLKYETKTTSMEPLTIILSTGDDVLNEDRGKGEEYIFQPDPDNVGRHIKFVLAKSYLTWKPHAKGGHMQSFSIDATYPDFKPWVAEKAKNKNLNKNEDIIYITIKVGKKSSLLPLEPIFDIEYIGDTKHGLDHYNETRDFEIINEKKVLKRFADDIFIPKSVSKKILSKIDCASYAYNENVRCSVEVNFSKHLYGDYSFVRKDLANWRKIDKRVREFVQSLVASDSITKEVFFKLEDKP